MLDEVGTVAGAVVEAQAVGRVDRSHVVGLDGLTRRLALVCLVVVDVRAVAGERVRGELVRVVVLDRIDAIELPHFEVGFIVRNASR